jgi:hypothetical protein
VRTFLIRVVQNDGIIYINSLKMDVSDNPDEWMTLQNVFFNRNILQRISDQFDYVDKAKLESAVNRDQRPGFSYGIKNGRSIFCHSANPVSYALPQDPTMALDFLAAYCSYLEDTAVEFSSIQFIDFDFEKKLADKNLKKKNMLALSRNKAANGSGAVKIMIDQILSLKNPAPEYQPVLKVLKKIQNAAAKQVCKISDLLQGLPRAAVMLDMDANSFTDGEVAIEDKLKRMYASARRMIGNDLGGEAVRMLDALHSEAKRRAFSTMSLENHPVLRQYIKEIILNEKFQLLSDGKIAVNFMSSKYLTKRREMDNLSYYDETLLQFANEFAAKAGLEFEQSNDLTLLVFTEASSKKLIAQQLHINSDFMKKIVRIKNDFNRFYKSAKERDGVLQGLPPDMVRLIIKTMYPEIAAVTNLDKLLTHDFFDQAKVSPLFPVEPPPEPEPRKWWFGRW